MRAQLEVHAGDPDQPERAALELTRALLSSFPRQRPVTLALIGFAPHPGFTTTPWTLDGVFEACIEAERTPVNLLTIGDAETGETLVRRAARERLAGTDGRELVERPSHDRNLSLRSHGQRRPFTIPREVVGSSLILCTPLLLRALEPSRPREWQGPIGLALAELARTWGYSPTPPKLSSGLRARPNDHGREAAAAGLELVAASFASASVIVDATWAGALEPASSHELGATGLRPRGADDRFSRAPIKVGRTGAAAEIPRLLGELDSPERCLAVTELGRLELDALLGVDGWLVRALGLPRREADLPTPQVESGTQSAGRWPQLSVTAARSQPTRLADRAIAGIRTQSKRVTSGLASGFASGLASGLANGLRAASREPLALPARVPGRFAPLWTARWYGEHERLGELFTGASRNGGREPSRSSSAEPR